jgi:hypothetical protein
MEKNDLTYFFNKFHKPLRNGSWSREFFNSMVGNIWFYSNLNGETFIIDFGCKFDNDLSTLARNFSDYRFKEFFSESTYLDYIWDFPSFYRVENPSVSPLIKKTVEFRDFIVLPSNPENKRFLLSLSREKKLINIL